MQAILFLCHTGNLSPYEFLKKRLKLRAACQDSEFIEFAFHSHQVAVELWTRIKHVARKSCTPLIEILEINDFKREILDLKLPLLK